MPEGHIGPGRHQPPGCRPPTPLAQGQNPIPKSRERNTASNKKYKREKPFNLSLLMPYYICSIHCTGKKTSGRFDVVQCTGSRHDIWGNGFSERSTALLWFFLTGTIFWMVNCIFYTLNITCFPHYLKHKNKLIFMPLRFGKIQLLSMFTCAITERIVLLAFRTK